MKLVKETELRDEILKVKQINEHLQRNCDDLKFRIEELNADLKEQQKEN